MITITFDEHDAATLAKLCKRSFLERLEPFAEDKKEAQKMLDALVRFGFKLEEQGFSLR